MPDTWIYVQEQDVRRGGSHLGRQGLVPLDPVMDVVEHGKTALVGLRVEGADTMPLAFVEVPELGVARVGIVFQVLPAHAVADDFPGLEPVDADAVQAVEDASAGEGLPDLGTVGKFDIGHPRHVAGPEDGDAVDPRFRHPGAGLDAGGEAVQAERHAQNEQN